MDLANSAGCPEGAYSLSNVDYTLLDHLYDAGARVLSNSWGCSSGTVNIFSLHSSNLMLVFVPLSVVGLLHLRLRPDLVAGQLGI